MITMQEVFNKVASHLLTQNCKSESELGCAYRGLGNTKCAIGVLITDEVYDSYNYEDVQWNDFGNERTISGNALEEQSITNLEVQEAVQKSLEVNRSFFGDPDNNRSMFELLEELQNIHDNHEPEAWKVGLTEIADDYELSKECLK